MPKSRINIMDIYKALIILLTVLVLGFPATAKADDPEVFYSWNTFEADKVASIWLIKRFIRPEADIKILPKGKSLENAIAFDTPNADFRRYHDRSTYECLLARYEVDDKKAVHLGRIIHDIEVNLWEEKAFDSTREIEKQVLEIIREAESDRQVIEKSLTYFDHLYDSLEVAQN